MDVALLDVDSKIPNLALMKISAYHKQRGDRVKLGYEPLFDRPDLAYASKVFDFTPEPLYVPECELLRGGSGYDLSSRLTEEQEAMFPDYSLYGGCNYSLGRFTRGCPNKCPWCIVPKMDGNKVREVARLEDFWDSEKHDTVRLLDDNIMADADIFARCCEQLSRAGVKAIWEALDVRLVNDQTAAALATVKQGKSIHFAWDSPGQEPYIEPALECLKRHGLKPWRFMFYVLIGFNTTEEYDLYRVEKLRSLGTYAFAMPYDKNDRYQKDFARWVNNKALFAATTWYEYDCPTNRARRINAS